MENTPRTDLHRPGAIIPGEYEYVFSYQMPTTDGGHPVPSFGLDCEVDYRIEIVSGQDKGRHEPGKHSSDTCCVARLRTVGATFATNGGSGKCTVCSTWYVYGDVWHHTPSDEYIHIGHNCADKYSLLVNRSKYEMDMRRRDAARAKVIITAKNKEERNAFLAQHEGLAADLELADKHYILSDLAVKFNTYKTLSEKQVALVRKLANEVRNPAPEEKNVPAPTGKMSVKGKVVSCKLRESQFGSVWKMTVKVSGPDGVWLCWGTCPSTFINEAMERQNGMWDLRGAEVEFTATLQAGRDAHFAIFKRPTKPVLISVLDIQPPR